MSIGELCLSLSFFHFLTLNLIKMKKDMLIEALVEGTLSAPCCRLVDY